MAQRFYDLHLHSCLSPCADNDNTPFNLVGMGALNGLQVMALTDHNTARNCPAFFAAAAQHGILPVPGMELTTAEEIHLLCLFPTLADALDFDRAVDAKRIHIRNRAAIFGEQWLWSEQDTSIGQEPDLLSNATALSLEEGAALAAQYHGVCYPAHIDRQANGVIAVLGDVPQTPVFSCVEFHDRGNVAAYTAQYKLAGKTVVVSSDAHTLSAVQERVAWLDLPDGDDDTVRRYLIARLQRGEQA